MNKLMKKVLTSKSARKATALSMFALTVVSVASPWEDKA